MEYSLQIKLFSQWVKVKSQRVWDPCSSAQVTSNFRVLTFTRQVRLQAPGVAGVVRECLIGPAHCSCTKTRRLPSRPDLLLSFKGKKNGQSRQLTSLAVQARIQCWLVLRLPGVRGGCTTTPVCWQKTRNGVMVIKKKKQHTKKPEKLVSFKTWSNCVG